MKWLPIQLAPRDGTRFLAVCPGPHIRIVRFDAADDRLPIGDVRGDVWPDVPTHFAPLPSDPYGVAAAPAPSEREQFEEALRRKPDALGWNLTDAMFWAWCAARNAGVSRGQDQTFPPSTTDGAPK